MTIQVVNLTNTSIPVASLGYTLKPFESQRFANNSIAADLMDLDVRKQIQVEVVSDSGGLVRISADGFGADEVTLDQLSRVKSIGISSAALSTTVGTPNAMYFLTDGADAGAKLTWAIPFGSSTYTWCWWLWPQAAYQA